MNSKKISELSKNSFVRQFVFAAISVIKIRDFPDKEKEVIHSDLVPRISGKVLHASLKEKVIPSMLDANYGQSPTKTFQPKIGIHPPVMAHRIITHPRTQINQPQYHATGSHYESNKNYGKITPLLNDPSVSTIECRGNGIPITIIRTGQKQITKISLNQRDIKEILKQVSEVTHIPLLEGVFKAAVDNFIINAVISNMIGSRFIIKITPPTQHWNKH